MLCGFSTNTMDDANMWVRGVQDLLRGERGHEPSRVQIGVPRKSASGPLRGSGKLQNSTLAELWFVAAQDPSRMARWRTASSEAAIATRPC